MWKYFPKHGKFESMVLLEIDVTQVEGIVANESILEETFVHEFELNGSLLEPLLIHILGFEEDMLVPDCNASIIDVVQCL